MALLLVVDDDPDIHTLLVAHLAPQGHEVRCASSGAEAIALAARHHPDAILLDFCLPRMDGARVFTILRADPLTHETPVIVMTAASLGWVSTRMPYDPRVHLIEKPLDLEQLDRLLHVLLPTTPSEL